MKMIEIIEKRLTVTSNEDATFKRLKDNYSVQVSLFSKDNNIYRAIISYKNDNSYNYTLKCGGKIVYKNKTKKQLLSLINKILEKEV